MRIGEVAEATGVSARSLRFYEANGLIRADRSAGGWRVFDDSIVERVVLIQHLFAAGLRSATVSELLPCLEAPPRDRTRFLDDQLRFEIGRLESRRRDLDRELEILRALAADVGASDPGTDSREGVVRRHS